MPDLTPLPTVPAPTVTPPATNALPEEDAFTLPPLSAQAVTFLTSDRYRESEAAVARTFGLSADDTSFLNEMDHTVLGGAMGIDGYIRALREEFPSLDTAMRDKLIGQLVADRFVPWADRLQPSAKGAAQKEGIALPPTPYYAVYDAPLTSVQAADEILKMVEMPLTGNMRDRLAAVVASRATGVRVSAQAEAQLIRSTNQGGLQLEPEQARKVVMAMGDLLGRVKIQEEGAVSSSSASTAAAATASVAQEASSSFRPSVGQPLTRPALVVEDPFQGIEQDVTAAKATMPQPTPGMADALSQAMAATMNRLTGAPDDPYLRRRLEQVVGTRLRNVRARNEVLSTLMRGSKVGGMELGREEAERLTALIEEGYVEWHERVAAAESAVRDSAEREQAAQTDARQAQEVAAHEAWRAAKVAGTKAAPVATPIPSAPGQHPLDAKEQASEKKAFGDLVFVPPKGAAPADFLAPAAPVVVAVPSVATPSPIPPKKSPVKISTETVKTTADAAQSRPRMDDVQPARPGLVGPREELARLSLTSFRRFGKTPQEAAAHVHDLLRLLGEESFNRRVEGIRAWQGNPLQKMYVELVAEAFSSATPLRALLAKKRAAGEDVFTDEELDALITLSGELRL